MTLKPLVAVPSDLINVDGHESYKCGDKYLRALCDCADVVPIIIPALDGGIDVKSLVARVDAVLLSGGLSNVHPSVMAPAHQGQQVVEPSDLRRDSLTQSLIKETLEQGKPLLGICRGIQELNVALGGSLHPLVHEVEELNDHREPKSDDIAVRYGPNHEVEILPGGLLADWISEPRFMTNSLHWQAVRELGQGLRIEAQAPDGLVEAVSLPSAARPVLAVQWHPEFQAKHNPQSRELFAGFRRAIDGADVMLGA